MTLDPADDISPYKGNIWDPSDLEWAEVDANKVLSTFRASYKAPSAPLPLPSLAPLTTMGAAVSQLGTAMQKTVRNAFVSPTKRAEKLREEQEREEERVRDMLEDLKNTYCSDPEGDLCDDIMRSVFLEDYSRTFTSSIMSPRSMHVIDLQRYFESDDRVMRHAQPRLCDAVATVLAHTSKECVRAFLNPSVKEFIYRRELAGSISGMILVVRRKGNEVICGSYINFGFVWQWKLYIKSLISVTGQWHEVFATTKSAMMVVEDGIPQWDTLQPDSPKDVVPISPNPTLGLPRKLQLSPSKTDKNELTKTITETDPKFVLFQSRVFAKFLVRDIWFYFVHMYECRATWEAVGEVKNIRVKRELVGLRAEDED